jgi:hypothetical protein
VITSSSLTLPLLQYKLLLELTRLGAVSPSCGVFLVRQYYQANTTSSIYFWCAGKCGSSRTILSSTMCRLPSRGFGKDARRKHDYGASVGRLPIAYLSRLGA